MKYDINYIAANCKVRSSSVVSYIKYCVEYGIEIPQPIPYQSSKYTYTKEDADKIIEMIKAIEYASRLKVTYLINNTNLMGETEYSHVEKGEAIVKEVSSLTNIPFFGNAVKKELAKDGDFSLDMYINMN